MAACLLNGIEFRPSDITVDENIYGIEHEAFDGTPTLMVAGTKNAYTLVWEGVPWATVVAVRAIWRLTTPFVFQHPDDGVKTVQRTIGGFNQHIVSIVDRRYAVTLKLREA